MGGYLWQTLHEMTQVDLRLFLHFVWGRSRLPPDGSPKWSEGFKIVCQMSGGDPDQWLPTAHTCFPAGPPCVHIAKHMQGAHTLCNPQLREPRDCMRVWWQGSV